MSCDLHIHSTCSDGAVPIEWLAPIAARTGLHAIADVYKRQGVQRKGLDLAAVLHCHLLPGVRGCTHPAVWLGRKETGLFPLMKGRKLDHGTA